jgi:hypothetical protein
MKTAIFSLAIGNLNNYRTCLSTVAKYSEKYKIPFFIATENNINFINHYFEKFQCFQLLEEYDRVLCIDADILITPTAKNIFEEYSDEEYLYAFQENSDLEHMDRDPWIETYDPDFDWPVCGDKKMYFNSGCVLYSKKHINLFDKIKEIKFTNKCFSIDGSEQTALNFAVAKNKIPFKSISYSFNRMNLGKNDPDNKRYQSDFIHYAGECRYGDTNKQKAIEKDYNYLYNNLS